MWDAFIIEVLYKNSIRALPFCCPNPAVGSVFTSFDGEILGQGYTQPYGDIHAEVVALQDVQRNHPEDVFSKGILYTSLTPCCHEGKTSSCVDFLLQKGVRKICIIQEDPNPLVYKKSLQKLKDAGVYIDMNCPQEYKERFAKINEIFFSRFHRELPWVTLKYAMTIDGKISTFCGDSKWISCDTSRNQTVQFLRATHDAISVGDVTVVKDDPQLTVRNFSIKNPPKRIIFNMDTPLSLESQIFSQDAKTIIVLPYTAEKSYKTLILDKGHEILEVSTSPNLREILIYLKAQQIDSILLEGGARMMSWFWKEKVIDKVFCFIAPKILGCEGISPFCTGNSIEKISQSVLLRDVSWEQIGETFLFSGYIR